MGAWRSEGLEVWRSCVIGGLRGLAALKSWWPVGLLKVEASETCRLWRPWRPGGLGGLKAWRPKGLGDPEALKAWKPGGWRPSMWSKDAYQMPMAIGTLEAWGIQKHMEGLGSWVLFRIGCIGALEAYGRPEGCAFGGLGWLWKSGGYGGIRQARGKG